MVDVTLSLIGANGDEIVFSDEGDFVLTAGLAGLGIPATQVRIDDSASDGGVWRFSKRGVRELDLPVVVLGADRATVEANLRRLTLLLSDRVGGVVLQAAYSSGEVWQLTQGHYVAGASGVRGDDGGLAWERWVLSLQFANPFWISQASESFAVGAPASSGSLLPNLAELVVSSAQAVGSVTVENPGDVDAFPVWSLRGPADSVTVSNGVESFVYDAPILASESVVVDTAAGTVTDQLGANKYGSLAASPSLFALPAGTSQVSVTATNASAGSWVDVETLATNVVANSSMEASSGSSAIRTNLVTNPSMEAVSTGAVVMRRNLCTNPSVEVDTAGWEPQSSATTTRVITEAYVGTASLRVNTPAAAFAGAYWLSSGSILTSGITYTASLWVKGPAGHVVYGVFRPGTGGDVNSADVTLTGSWQRISVTHTGASGTAQIMVRQRTAAAVTFYVDALLLEASSTVGDFFDGSTTDALGWDYAWSGTANASISTAACAATTVRTNLVTNPSFEVDTAGWFVSGTATFARDTTQAYSGAASLKVIATSATGGASTNSFDVSSASTQFTASVWVKGEAGKVFDLRLVERTSADEYVGESSSGNITATGSWQRISITRTFGATGLKARVQIFNRTSAGQTFYVDAAQLEVGSTASDYFDGSFQPAGDFSYGWSGTANASTSVQRGASVFGWNTPTIQSSIQKYVGSTSGRWIENLTNSPSERGPRYTATGLTVGTTYTASAYIYQPVSGTVQVAVRNSISGTWTLGTAVTTANAWVRISATWVAAETSSLISFGFMGSTVYGKELFVDAAMLEASPIVGAYFDGTTISNDSDFTIAWNGYAHASTSSFYADAISGINGMTPVNAVSNRSSQWFKVGTKSYRIIPTQTGNESYGYTPTYTVTPGKQYTATGVVRIPEPLLGTLHTDALKLRVNINNGTSYVKTVAAPNIAGEYTLTVTFTAPTGASTARLELMNGASAGNGNVWWDTVGLIDLPDSPFFDGNTTSLRENGYAWTGTTNDSTSVWKRREIQGATLISCNYQPRKEIVH